MHIKMLRNSSSIGNSIGFLDFFFYFVSICLTVSRCLYICLQSQVFEGSQLLTSPFIYVSLVSALELKTCRLRMYQNAQEFFRKIRGWHYVQGLGQNSVCSNNQHLLVLLDMCVVWWFCEMFVFCLSSHLSLFLPGCEQLHYSTTTVLQIIFQSALTFE